MVAAGDGADCRAGAPDPREPRHGVGPLPLLHKDPFDRILIAQAKAEGLGLVTNDSPISEYPIQTVW